MITTTSAARAATTPIVSRTESRNVSSLVSPPVERRRVRCGSRLAATAWKRTTGARATISTLKMKPAAAAPGLSPDEQRPAVEEDLLGEHHHQHRGGEAPAAGEGELGDVGGRWRARIARSALRRRSLRRPHAAPHGPGDDEQAQGRPGDDAEGHRVDALGDPDRDGERERQAPAAVDQQERREDVEPPGAREQAAAGRTRPRRR